MRFDNYFNLSYILLIFPTSIPLTINPYYLYLVQNNFDRFYSYREKANGIIIFVLKSQHNSNDDVV